MGAIVHAWAVRNAIWPQKALFAKGRKSAPDEVNAEQFQRNRDHPHPVATDHVLLTMCGRFARTSPVKVFAKLFDVKDGESLEPSYNVAPTQSLLAARAASEETRELTMLHWGLVPFWSKGPDPKYSMINARSDAVATKPAYREPFKQRRCLIAADGFFEWKRVGNKKQPYYIRLRGGQPFAFAGLWDHWEADGQVPIDSCTIITCDSNQLVGTIHDRMPVILPPKVYGEWLDIGTKRKRLESLLKPCPNTLMEMWAVGLEVNSTKNNSANLLNPLPTI